MSIKENNLPNITASDLSLNDYVRVINEGSSRNIQVSDLLDIVFNNTPVGNYLPISGGTLNGSLTIDTATPTISMSAGAGNPATVNLIGSSTSQSILNLGDVSDNDIGQVRYDNTTNTLYLKANTVDVITATSTNTTVNNNLIVTGTSTFTGTTTINNALTLGNNLTISSPNTLTAGGATTLSDTLTVTGVSTFNGDVDTDVASLLTTNGNVRFNASFTTSATGTFSVGSRKIENVGTPIASTDAATKGYIDDELTASANGFYREGTFTPTIRDTGGNIATTSLADGYYERIGKMVHISGRITCTSIAGLIGSVVYIGGLPYDWHGQLSYAGVSNVIGLAGAVGQGISGAVTSTNRIILYVNDVSTGESTLEVAKITNTFSVVFSATYRTNDA